MTLTEQLIQERKDGMTESQSAEKHALTIAEIRALISFHKKAQVKAMRDGIFEDKRKGMTNAAIAEARGVSEKLVRNILKEGGK